MGELLARDFPQYRTVGTLFSPAEDNSVHNKGKFAIEMRKRGISLVMLPVSSHGELADAALALAAKPIDAIVQLTDNQSAVGFTAIARAAARAKKPLLCFTEAGVQQGAAAGVTLSYRQAGYDAALKAAKIMRGAPPSAIPFSRPSHVQVIVSEDNARNLRMTLPASLVKRADKRLVPAH
jgi:putative ABC transport system substrate-binding protein